MVIHQTSPDESYAHDVGPSQGSMFSWLELWLVDQENLGSVPALP